MVSLNPVERRDDFTWRNHTLRADVEFRPDLSRSCPIANVNTNVCEIQSTVMDDECLVDLTLPNGRVIQTEGTPREESCFCRIFQEFDSVPHFEEIRDGVLRISTYLEDRSKIKDLLQKLRAVSVWVRLIRLTAIGEETGRQTVLLDMDVLTEKQWEALELAVERGYYGDVDIDMESIAAELDISNSALSQRLKRAQANLANEIVN